jgi:hypothetical protein
MAVYWDAGWSTLQRRLVAMEAVSTSETSGNLYKTTQRAASQKSVTFRNSVLLTSWTFLAICDSRFCC